MPNSFSLPFNTFLQTNVVQGSNDKYTTFKVPTELDKELLDVVGPEFGRQIKDGERRVVTSCGSGMTAGVLWLGLKLLDAKNISLYDEVRCLSHGVGSGVVADCGGQSWTGYASRTSSVIEKAT
jgi:thiosulfate/3-mercaptopyruvate sulfurtransferase